MVKASLLFILHLTIRLLILLNILFKIESFKTARQRETGGMRIPNDVKQLK